MKRGTIWVLIVVLGTAVGLSAEPQRETTQGEFAIELATRLDLGMGFLLEEENAIDALTRIGIRPEGGFRAEAPATEVFVAQIQKSIQELLKKLTKDLGLPVPPTLDLEVVSTEPFGGRTIFREPRDFQEIAPAEIPKR